MRVFTLKWVNLGKRDRTRNCITVEITALDESGSILTFQKQFQEWIGVLTNDIQSVVKHINHYFQGVSVSFVQVRNRSFRSLTPFFYERLNTGNFDYEPKSFYKLYLAANTYEVGDFLNQGHIAYYEEEDWLLRVYLECFFKFGKKEFYYTWIDIDEHEENLISSIGVMEETTEFPPITIASFDLETAPWDIGAERIPTGHNVNDRIVMISLAIDDGRDIKTHLFYLNPISERLAIEGGREYFTEKEMLEDFLKVLADPKILVLTGYNINNFDMPCVFARLVLLGMKHEWKHFTSQKVGVQMVTTYRNKIVVDMYNFVDTFLKKDLPSLKLDDVAFAKLGERKVPIRAVAIHFWYHARERLTAEILRSDDLTMCYEITRPDFPENQFGTFKLCMEYCLKDSTLVLDLLRKEKAIPFLMVRANVSTLNMEQALYLGNSNYIMNVFKSYGTALGYNMNYNFFKNQTSDGGFNFLDFACISRTKDSYQGALNYCLSDTFHEDTTVFDFESLYPSAIQCANLSMETATVMHVSNFSKLPAHVRDCCQVVPYRLHFDSDFKDDGECGDRYSFPLVEKTDQLLMISHKRQDGFISVIISHFIAERRKAKLRMKGNAFFFNQQYSIKIFLNSIYGCLGSMAIPTPLSNLALGMSVTAFGRYILLGAYKYLKSRGECVPYCDTDSLFVARCKTSNRDVNAYLGLKCINLQYEKTVPYLFFMGKKRYCYENERGDIQKTGFAVKSNILTKKMVDKVLRLSFEQLKTRKQGTESDGWIILINVLIDAYSETCNPTRYFTTRKTRMLAEYSPKCNAPQVRLLCERPEKEGTYIQYTKILSDTCTTGKNVFLDECEKNKYKVDFESLFVTQRKPILSLLNSAFFKYSDIRTLMKIFKEIMNQFRWKSIVNSAIVCKNKFGEDLLVLRDKRLSYDF